MHLERHEVRGKLSRLQKVVGRHRPEILGCVVRAGPAWLACSHEVTIPRVLKTGEQARTHREMRLQELRTHRRFSQEVLAKAMHVSQASISQTERRDDVMLSTLQNYIEGLGGKLRVVAEFPGEKIELEFGAQSRLSK